MISTPRRPPGHGVSRPTVFLRCSTIFEVVHCSYTPLLHSPAQPSPEKQKARVCSKQAKRGRESVSLSFEDLNSFINSASSPWLKILNHPLYLYKLLNQLASHDEFRLKRCRHELRCGASCIEVR